MSVHLSSQVWKLKTPDAATKLVLLKLADNANDDGECWPSLTTIARETCLDRSTVCRKIAYLAAVGALSRVPGHTGVSTRYRLEIKPGDPDLEGSRTAQLVAPRDQGSRTTRLGVVAQRDGGSRTVRHQPSVNRHIEPSLNHQEPVVDDFDAFWKAYPKKIGKGAARTAWKKCKPPIQIVLDALSVQARSDQWCKDHGQFIPNPSTWINQGRWEDELPSSLADPPNYDRKPPEVDGSPFVTDPMFAEAFAEATAREAKEEAILAGEDF